MKATRDRSFSAAAAAIAVVIVIIFLVSFLVLPNILANKSATISSTGGTSTFSSTDSTDSSTSSASTSRSSKNYTVLGPSSPCISSGQNVSYSSDYVVLVKYALNVINTNRTNFGLSNVTLSPILSGQEHANSMLDYNYFSHWDTQGCKPYMRYTSLNGTGYVEENIAFDSAHCVALCPFTSTSAVEQAINKLEWEMVYNDSTCCQNGHAKNILDQFHNRVSIGIAYNPSAVYFVEDFENYIATIVTPFNFQTNQTVHLQGPAKISSSEIPNGVFVYYEPLPSPLNASTLNSNYQKPYDSGTYIGSVTPCSSVVCSPTYNGISVYASTWNVNSTSVNVSFSMSDFLKQYGTGVYTLYLMQANNYNASLTSVSIFVSS